MFPTTLTGFYRADRLTRQIAAELLAYHLPDADHTIVDAFVDRLVSGYHAHDYPIMRAELRHMGLRVIDASPEEEALMWEILRECRRRRDEVHADACIGASGDGGSWLILNRRPGNASADQGTEGLTGPGGQTGDR
jgi:hypothetical protein